MRVLAASLAEACRKLSDDEGFKWLFEFEVPTTPPTRYRLVPNSTPVEYGTDSTGAPLVYSPAPIAHGGLEWNSDNETARLQLQVGNANRVMMPDLEDYAGLTDMPVVIRIVHVSALADPNAHVRLDGVVESTTADADRVTFEVGLTDLFGISLPARRFTKYHCGHTYGDELCGAPIDDAGFLADFPTCPYTLDGCRARGAGELAHGLPVLHPQRFGGQPGIPRPSSR